MNCLANEHFRMKTDTSRCFDIFNPIVDKQRACRIDKRTCGYSAEGA